MSFKDTSSRLDMMLGSLIVFVLIVSTSCNQVNNTNLIGVIQVSY